MTRHCHQSPGPVWGRLGRLRVVAIIAAALGLAVSTAGCTNKTYPNQDANANTLYNSMSADSMSAELMSLDPGETYSTASNILMDIVEAPLQYNYLARPYKLEPLLASEMPKRRYENVEYDGSTYRCPIYTVHLKKHVMYQNHPCFVKEYHHLTNDQLRGISTLKDFKQTTTREMTADDIVYGVHRLADPRINFPIYGIFRTHLLGFDAYEKLLSSKLAAARMPRAMAAGTRYNRELDEQFNPIRLDYNEEADKYPFIRKVDRYTFELVEIGKKIDRNAPNTKDLGEGEYPQILHWMTHGFFAPIPHESVEFFSQPGVLKLGITFDKSPVGTGPYMIDDYDPTSQVVLTRNPNYRVEKYPSLAKPAPGDSKAFANYKRMKENGMLADSGKRLPFVDKIVFRIEREAPHRWNRFIRGDYSTSGILADRFDETISRNSRGEVELTESMAGRGIKLLQTTTASLIYEIFNMDDPVFGGYSEKARKLRQAISIAIDTGEMRDMFHNGMGLEAQGPIPPGIFGHRSGKAGINPYIFNWDPAAKRPIRKSIEEAKKLLAEAGYPGGFDADGKPLTIDYISYIASSKARGMQVLLRKQLNRINIRLDITLLDYNEYYKTIMSGSYQMATQGWAADYPDPETFLLLFHRGGWPPGQTENTPHYYNAEYEALYSKMCWMQDGPDRLAVIQKMIAILRKDAPAVFEVHGVASILKHNWLHNYIPCLMAKGTHKYLRIDVDALSAYRKKYNVPSSRNIGS